MNIWEWPREWYSFASAKCYLRSRSQSSTSPWTGRRNVYGPHSQIWVIEVAMDDIMAPRAFAVEAFLERLGGSSGLVRMGSAMQRQPQWNLEATKVITPWSDGTFFSDGSGWVGGLLPPFATVRSLESTGATSVVIGSDALPASTARVFRRGDLVEFQRNATWDDTPGLHRIMVDANTNANSETRIEIRPPLRKGLAVGDKVNLDYPSSVFRLADDDQGGADYQPPVRAGIGFTLIENVL